MKHFCPICGCILNYDFNQYTICPCCGNQGNVTDDINKTEAIKKDEEYYYFILSKLNELYQDNKEAPKEMRDYLDSTVYTKEEAWEMLRNEWIQKGFKWKNSNKDEKPLGWNEKMAKEQLKNIKIFLD